MDAPARTHGPLGRAGMWLVRKRGLVLAPLFALSVLRIRKTEHEVALEVACGALAALAWALRLWAMGYRNWVRGEGTRHLMTRGPYALLRHPRYVANFLAGLAWFALGFDPWFALAYVVLYWAVLGPVIVREEEKLAQDYPGFAEWRARVPAVVPAIWRLREVHVREEGDAFQLAPVVRGLEPLKVLGFATALVALAWWRRTHI